jgi:hypothetical protein
MAVNYNTRIVNSGLVLNLDAGNTASLNNVSANLITIPENLSNAVWGKGSVDATFTSASAPNGSQTVYSITEQATSAQHLLIYSIGTVAINDTFTWSGYFKNNTNATQIILHTNGEGTVTFNISGASVGTVAGTSGGNTLSSSITSAGNGWYRCSATFRKANTVGTFYVSNQNGLGVYTGNVSISYYAWGLQLELGSTVTPYYSTSSRVTSTWNDVSGLDNHASLLPYTLNSVEVLVVAGGGGGGNDVGGGGGAGGVIYRQNYSVSPNTTYTVIVGAGGSGGIAFGAIPTNGANSQFDTLLAIGGGYGGSYNNVPGNLGGSGGGGAGGPGGTQHINPGAGIIGQGNSGSAGIPPVTGYSSGGGGGAGGAGLAGILNGPGGAGGPGIAYNISGTLTFYGGGGGGGGGDDLGSDGRAFGGIGGGGGGAARSGSFSVNASFRDGQPNTGGGGGGTGGWNNAGAGGSGIVIVRYLGYQKATGGTVTYVNGYTIHTFTSVGSTTFTPNANVSPVYSTFRNGLLTFNGTTHQAIVPNSASLCATTDLTINLWVYVTASVNGLGLVAKGPETGDYDYMVYLTGSSGTITFYKKNSAGVAESTNGTSRTTINNWTNICYTVSAGINCLGYIDGVQVETKTFTNSGIRVTENPLRIGRAWSTYLTGYLPVVQVYNRALSATEVRNNYHALKGRYDL